MSLNNFGNLFDYVEAYNQIRSNLSSHYDTKNNNERIIENIIHHDFKECHDSNMKQFIDAYIDYGIAKLQFHYGFHNEEHLMEINFGNDKKKWLSDILRKDMDSLETDIVTKITFKEKLGKHVNYILDIVKLYKHMNLDVENNNYDVNFYMFDYIDDILVTYSFKVTLKSLLNITYTYKFIFHCFILKLESVL